ncbi:MAG TPA: pilus assembly protein PilM, partial [Planctomycetota bacterium]|nr:pilus assembly protein PilM [Planctomycetota bacterium]
MPTVVGVDIGLQSIKVAVVEGSAKQPRIASFIDHKLEGGQTTRALGPADLGDLIAQILSDRGLTGQQAVASIPATSCLIREVTVPFTRPDQIRKTIKFQAESVFHAVSIDDLIVEYYKLSEQGEKSRLLVVGLKKDRLRERLEALELAQVDASALDLDATALYGALYVTPAVKEGKRILGVDLGGGTMKMVAIEAGKLRGLRSTRLQAASIKVGGGPDKKRSRDMSRSGSRDGFSLDELKKNLSESEQNDVFFGGEDEGRLPVVILDEEQTEIFDFAEAPEAERQDVLQKLFLEIDRSLASTRLEGPLDQIFLTGGGAAVEGIEKAFADHFGAPCERVAFEGAVPSKLSRDAMRSLDLYGAVALGLALKGIGIDPAGLDFRKEEFAYQGKFGKAKRGVACALVLLFVLFFVVAYDYQMVEMERLMRKQDHVKQYQREVYLTLFPEEASKPPEDLLIAL